MENEKEAQEQLEAVRSAVSPEFEIVRELGRGGMAVVYLARAQHPQREVALKVMNPDISTRLMRERFLREIDLASKLTHPHVVPVFTAGESGDLLYYAMPYISGESLRARLAREKTLPLSDALQIAREVASALSYAHGEGIVHRDIKPENILLADGHAMVVDFGVAKAFGEGASLTRTGVPIGTPAYMSPEQWTGPEVDGRTDLYSLGCVLFEMVFGRVPQASPSQKAEEASELLRKSGRGIEATRVAPIVARALAASPDERFATADEFLEELGGRTSNTAAARQNNRWLSAAFTGVVLLLLAITILPELDFLNRDEPFSSRVVVAVLDNQTGDSSQAPLGVMAADWITQGLTRTGLVEVVGTRSSLAFSGEESPTEAIARLVDATSADIVISGSYYQSGQTTQFSVQFTDTQDDRVLLSLPPVSSHVDSPLVAVEILRQRVMSGMGTLFDDEFMRWAAVGYQPPLYDAYEEFVAGQLAFNEFDYAGAMGHLFRSSEMDPEFSAPLLLAAFASATFDRWPLADSIAHELDGRRETINPLETHVLDWILGLTSGDSRRARGAIADAVQLAPDQDIQIFAGITSLWLNRPEEALVYFESVDTEDVTSLGAIAYWQVYSATFHLLERHEEELRLVRAARDDNPASLFFASLEMRALAALGRLDEIAALIEDARDWDEGVFWDNGDFLRSTSLELGAHRYDAEARQYAEMAVEWYRANLVQSEFDIDATYGLARSLYSAEQFEEAETLFATLAVAEPDSIGFLGYAAAAAARMGNPVRAQILSDSLTTMQRDFLFGHVPYWRGRIAAVLGQRDVAMDYLREANDMGRRMTWATHADVDLKLLRDYEPFRGFIRAPL